ncbi:transglutaminase domain-containing protein [Anaerobutyricum hallii]|uniref:transglutaminase domain-containing protein n=1 Tax=Anaerobutyricum hallii TaxID=39488 RepID=UPI0022E884CA|nr:transglutaminase domain-containing protein [Anaerobutyricum hallii]
MKKTMHNYRKLLNKNIMLALMFCLTLGIGIFTNSVQVKAANSLKIGNIQAYGGSQVAFEATFKMNGYQKIEIYRSISGGAFQLVDNFTEEGELWNTYSEGWYTVGNKKKVTCYADNTKVAGQVVFEDDSVTVGNHYSYKVVLTCYDGSKITSGTVSVAVTLDTAEILNIYSADAKKVKIKWRRVSKAQGYQIYRTEGKKWKVIKTIKSGKKVTFVDKKVKKNKVYRYKVRAYGTVKGKKVYGNFGYVCKASLKKPTVKGAYKKGSIYGPALNNNQLMQVRRVVQSFKTNYIKKGMSNYEKAFIAFNYLNQNCKYATRGWQYNGANTAWGALVYGEAQCSGYARGMKALCDAIGVPCYYVHANKKALNPSHQWNQVKVDGKWYIVDAQSGYFLAGSKTWRNEIGMSWDTKGLPKCSGSNHKRGGFYGI